MSQLEYTDHLLVGRAAPWPLDADGRQLVSIDAAARIMQNCDFIAHAGAFAVQLLQQWLQRHRHALSRLRLPPPLYAVHAHAAAACLRATQAMLIRVRCSEVAFIATRLTAAAAAAALFPPPLDLRCRLAQGVANRVFCGYQSKVRVRPQRRARLMTRAFSCGGRRVLMRCAVHSGGI